MSTVNTVSFGTGPLSRAAALLHTLLTVEALLLATSAPGLVGLLFLGPDPANLPLAAVCLLPLGPPPPPRCTPCTTAAATSPTFTRPACTRAAGGSTPSPR